MSVVAAKRVKNQKSKKQAINIFSVFAKGDVLTKLSFLIMGSANIARKQFLKGSIYLLTEIAFIYYMVVVGIEKLIGFTTLGTNAQSQVYDEVIKINRTVPGDNSMLFLIYGVATIAIVIVFILFYISNIYSAYKLQRLLEEGKPIPTLKDDIKELFDKRFHVTLMTLPIVGIAAFTVLPLCYMILIAFTNYDLDHQPPGQLFTWVGLANFGEMLNQSSKFGATFGPVLGWTLVWAVVATFSNYFLGIVLALMINKKGIKLKKMWRTIFVITMAIPQFISLLIMRQMLNDYGVINVALQSLGLTSNPVQFLSDPTLARISVLTVNLWVGIPYTMLVTTGILMNIPNDLYEAAEIDGASKLKAFTKITMPYVFFVTAPYLITQFIGNINNFNLIYFLTKGEPMTTDYYFAGKTDLLVTWLYRLTADRKDYSRASTIGIAVFVLSAVFALIAFRLTSSNKQEEDFQ